MPRTPGDAGKAAALSNISPASAWLMEHVREREAAAAAAEPPTPIATTRTSGLASKASRVLLAIAGLIAGFLLVGWLTGNGDRAAQDRVNAYLSGTDGEPFFASDAQFRASFPSLPHRSMHHLTVAGKSVPLTEYSSGSSRTYFAVGVMELSRHAHFNLNLAVNGMAAGEGGQVERSHLTTFHGRRAAECTISGPHGSLTRGLIVRGRSRIYELIVVGFHDEVASYQKFKKSFVITG